MLNEILKNWLIIVFANWGHWLVVIPVWSGPGSKYYEYIWILLCFSMWFSEFGYLRLGPTSILLHFLSCLHSVIKIWISLCMCLTLFHLGKDDFSWFVLFIYGFTFLISLLEGEISVYAVLGNLWLIFIMLKENLFISKYFSYIAIFMGWEMVVWVWLVLVYSFPY